MAIPIEKSDIDNKHPVIRLLLKRLQATQEERYETQDESHLAIAVEGGGMRGAVSAGMLLALEQLGVCNVVDSIYGSSAGGMNVSFFVTNEGPLGATVYYDAINNKRFIDFTRLVTSRPVVDLDYLLGTVLEEEVPLDWDMVLSSGTPVNIIATNLDTLESDVINNFETKSEIKRALRASATIPIIGGDPVKIGGSNYIDASFTESIPYRSVLDNGATHVLVLSSRSADQMRSGPGSLVQKIGSYYLNSYSNGLGDLFEERAERYKKALQEINDLTSNPKDPPHVYRVTTPKKSARVSKFEQDRQNILQGMISGATTMLDELELSSYKPTEVLNFYSNKGKEMKRSLNISK